MNLVVFSGNLARDAKLINTSGGKVYCVTALALREDLRPENKAAVFVDIIIWGDRAVKLANLLTKGKPICITGRLETVKSTKDNHTYTTPRVVVDTLEFLSSKKTTEIIEIKNNGNNEVDNKITETTNNVDTSINSGDDVPF